MVIYIAAIQTILQPVNHLQIITSAQIFLAHLLPVAVEDLQAVLRPVLLPALLQVDLLPVVPVPAVVWNHLLIAIQPI